MLQDQYWIDNTSKVCIEVTINSALGYIVEFEYPINVSIYNYTFYFNNTLTQCLYIPSGFNNTNISVYDIDKYGNKVTKPAWNVIFIPSSMSYWSHCYFKDLLLANSPEREYYQLIGLLITLEIKCTII